jgi:isochorismate synthase
VLRNQGAYTFALEVGEAGQSRTLIGASPELLVSRRGRAVLANPLAGSAPRCADPEQDRAVGAALLLSRKDRREHAFVVEAVAASLTPYCVELSVPEQPALIQTATMWHLSTQVRGQLRDSATCALRLATALHPTPAVCGTPTAPAQAAIRSLEGFERGYYAGLVGWSDAGGDGDWIVTIRCAEVERERIRLYAGAGIVDGSDAEAELNETSAKFRTVLSAMGIEL